MSEFINNKDTQTSIAVSRIYQESTEICEGNSLYGNLAFLLSSNMDSIDSFAEFTGKFIGDKVTEKVYNKQYFNPIYGNFKNFLSRNIYLSKSKKQKMENERYIAGTASAFVAEAGIKFLSHGVTQWFYKKNKYITFNDIHKLLYMYASQNIKNSNTKSAFIELSKIRTSFPLSKEKTANLLSDAKQSTGNLSDIIGNSSFMSDVDFDLRKNISYLLYAIHCNKFGDYCNETDPLKSLLIYYQALGFHDNYAKELLRENSETYKKITDDQIKYLQLARSFVKNISIQFPNIDMQKISSHASEMAKYDPYSIRRQITQNTTKITIQAIYSKKPLLVIQAAGTALAQLNLEDNTSFIDVISNFLSKNSISNKDIETIFENSKDIKNCSQ